MRVGQKRGVDQRSVFGVGASQRDIAPALGAHQCDVQRVTVTQVVFARVVVHDAGAQRQLDVGRGRALVGKQESLGFSHIAGEDAGALAAPLEDGAHDGRQPGQGQPEGRVFTRRAVDQHRGDVVMQVLANAGQVMQHGNAVLSQVGRRTDAGEHQQLG